MTQREVDQMIEEIKLRYGERVENFVFIADIEDERGEAATIMAMQGTNAAAIGLCEIGKADILEARSKANYDT